MTAKFEMVEVKDAGGKEIHNMMNVDGLRLSTFGEDPKEIADIVHNLVNLPIRDDDVMLCSAAKSGTHWVFEIISMLLNGKPQTIPYSKGALMAEVVSQSQLNALPSPRVLNCHLPFHLLPKQMKEKKTKIVLSLRNPKDVFVSFYHHHKGLKFFNYDGTFEDYLPTIVAGELDYGQWFDYVLQMEKEIEKGEHDIHLVYYEDLKENGFYEIKKIVKFLGVPDNNELCAAIHEKCQFKNMVKDKEYSPQDAEKTFKGNYSFYRKGEVGDWKNYFTVAMSEEFDRKYNERMKNSKLKFRYELSRGDNL